MCIESHIGWCGSKISEWNFEIMSVVKILRVSEIVTVNIEATFRVIFARNFWRYRYYNCTLYNHKLWFKLLFNCDKYVKHAFYWKEFCLPHKYPLFNELLILRRVVKHVPLIKFCCGWNSLWKLFQRKNSPCHEFWRII